MFFLKDYQKVGIYYEGQEITYRDIIIKAKQLGEHHKIEEHSKSILFSENRPEFLYAFLGIWNRNATCVCIDASFDEEEFLYYVNDSEAERIFTSKTNEQVARKTVEKSGRDVEIIVLEEEVWEEKEYRPEELVLMAPEKETVALMLYTSGTTGNPKGVMITFDNILYNIESLDEYNMFLESDVTLALLPMHHIFPLLGSGVIPLSHGASIIFLKELSSQAMMEALQKYQVTMMIGVPKLWEMLHKKIMEEIKANKIAHLLFKVCESLQSKSLSKIIFGKLHQKLGGKLRYFVSGGSKLDEQVAKDFFTLGITICEGYGMTETAPMISFNPLSEAKPGTAGKILRNLDLLIAEDGEILVKGRNVMKGYYKREEATKETIDEKGYLHTGDLGEIRNGYLYITGRKKEMIVLSNGKNINPIDIEFWIQGKTNLIQEIVVLEWKGLLTAAIYPNFQAIRDEKIVNIEETLKWDVIDKYNKQAPDYRKVLDTIIVPEEFPKTKIGKIRRFMIPAVLENIGKKEIISEEPSSEEYAIIKEYLSLAKARTVVPQAHLELDLGMDSLDMIEFISFLGSRFGMVVQNETILENSTVESISAYVEKHRGEDKIEDVNWKEILSKETKVDLPYYGIFARIGKILNYLLFWSYFRIDIKGREYLDEKPTIYVGNHQSFLDICLITRAFPFAIMKNCYFMAKVVHFKSFLMKFFASQANVVTLDINDNITEVLQTMAKVLREGKSILIFPEGVRTRDGKLNSFKKSFAILAKELNVEVQPFVIQGAYELFPTSARMPKMGKVQLEILPKFSPKAMSYEEITEEARKRISEKLNHQKHD